MRQQKHEKKTLDKRKNTKHSQGGAKKKKITCEEKKHNFLAISNMGNI